MLFSHDVYVSIIILYTMKEIVSKGKYALRKKKNVVLDV